LLLPVSKEPPGIHLVAEWLAAPRKSIFVIVAQFIQCLQQIRMQQRRSVIVSSTVTNV